MYLSTCSVTLRDLTSARSIDDQDEFTGNPEGSCRGRWTIREARRGASEPLVQRGKVSTSLMVRSYDSLKEFALRCAPRSRVGTLGLWVPRLTVSVGSFGVVSYG